MRDPKRIPLIIQKLEEIWKKHPDLRLGQLIDNTLANSIYLFFIEDDVLIKELEKAYADRSN